MNYMDDSGKNAQDFTATAGNRDSKVVDYALLADAEFEINNKDVDKTID